MPPRRPTSPAEAAPTPEIQLPEGVSLSRVPVLPPHEMVKDRRNFIDREGLFGEKNEQVSVIVEDVLMLLDQETTGHADGFVLSTEGLDKLPGNRIVIAILDKEPTAEESEDILEQRQEQIQAAKDKQKKELEIESGKWPPERRRDDAVTGLELLKEPIIDTGIVHLMDIPHYSKLAGYEITELSEAAQQIETLMQAPLLIVDRANPQPNTPEHKAFIKHRENLRQAMQFLQTFNKDLIGTGKHVARSTAIAVDRREGKPTIFSFTSGEKNRPSLGKIGDETVDKVEIVVQTAPLPKVETRPKRKTTEQTIKYRTLNDNGREIACVRYDIHGSTDTSKRDQAVEVDIDTGLNGTSVTHQPVTALGKGPEALEAFRYLQAALVMNLTEKILLRRQETRQGVKAVVAKDNDGSHFTRIKNALDEAKNILGIGTTEDVTEIIEKPVPTEQKDAELDVIKSEIKKATDPHVVGILRNSYQSLSVGNALEKLDDQELTFCLLLGIKPQRITPSVFASLNGRKGDLLDLLRMKDLPQISMDKSTHPVFIEAEEQLANRTDLTESEFSAAIEKLSHLATVAETLS